MHSNPLFLVTKHLYWNKGVSLSMIYLIKKKKQGTKGEETQQWWEKVIRKYFSMQKNIPLLTLKSFGWLNSNSDGAFSIYVIYNIILILKFNEKCTVCMHEIPILQLSIKLLSSKK